MKRIRQSEVDAEAERFADAMMNNPRFMADLDREMQRPRRRWTDRDEEREVYRAAHADLVGKLETIYTPEQLRELMGDTPIIVIPRYESRRKPDSGVAGLLWMMFVLAVLLVAWWLGGGRNG